MAYPVPDRLGVQRACAQLLRSAHDYAQRMVLYTCGGDNGLLSPPRFHKYDCTLCRSQVCDGNGHVCDNASRLRTASTYGACTLRLTSLNTQLGHAHPIATRCPPPPEHNVRGVLPSTPNFRWPVRNYRALSNLFLDCLWHPAWIRSTTPMTRASIL